MIRLGNFTKQGYKDNFSKGELARELVCMNNDYDNLKKENQQLKEELNKYTDPKDLTLMFMYCDEKAKDKIKCLEQENQQLKEQLESSIGIVKHNMMIQKHVDRERKLQKKIEAIEKTKEEVIEYINNNISKTTNDYINGDDIEFKELYSKNNELLELLKILRGVNDE